MNENIFNYLNEYGFTKEDLFEFPKINDQLYFYDLTLIKSNIEFFEQKGLVNNEIIDLFKKNPYLFTIGSKRKNMLDDIYNNIFSKEELKSLILRYEYLYTLGPKEVEEKIENIKKLNLNIKEEIIKNPDILYTE